jgi:hypothetical protein
MNSGEGAYIFLTQSHYVAFPRKLVLQYAFLLKLCVMPKEYSEQSVQSKIVDYVTASNLGSYVVVPEPCNG